MKRRLLIIKTLKSIRVVAWLVTFCMTALGFIFFVGEPTNELGAGKDFVLAMLIKTFVALLLFVGAIETGSFASKITHLFKKCGIK